MEVHPKRVAPGQVFELEGGGFFTGCEDAFVNGEPVDEERPKHDVEIRLRQGSHEWRLGSVNASDDYSISARLRLPEGVEPGRAIVVAGDARTPLRITGG